MKLRTRLALLFVLLVAGFGLSAALLHRAQREEAGSIYETMRQERSGLLDRLLKLRGQSLENFASDYSLWDEMVQFVQKADPAWAKVNIEASLANFEAQAAWVLRPDGTLLYSSSEPGMVTAAPIDDQAFLDHLRREKTLHYFAETPAGLMEFRTAPIQPSDDLHREKPPQGWFLVGRRWDVKYLSTLAETLQCQVTFGPVEAIREGDMQIIHLARELPDWRGQPLRNLHVFYESRLLARLFEGNKSESYMLYLFGFTVISLVTVGISHWVIRPLSLLGHSLESGRSEPITGLLGRPDEFGHLARQISHSFLQRDALRDSEERLRYAMELRGRLARDLHDGIIQSIYAAGLGIESVCNLKTTEPATRQRLEACQKMLNDTLWQVRKFIETLEPEGNHAQSPAQSLATLAASICSLQSIPITTDLDPALAAGIDQNQELHLLQAARELLSNALQHSGARQVHLSLKTLPNGLARMEVSDNGIGFDPAQRIGAGRGLSNLATRAREFGAQIEIHSAPRNGTRISIQFRPSLASSHD